MMIIRYIRSATRASLTVLVILILGVLYFLVISTNGLNRVSRKTVTLLLLLSAMVYLYHPPKTPGNSTLIA